MSNIFDLKCHYCGGKIFPTYEKDTYECEYCGRFQKKISPDEEKKSRMFEQADKDRKDNRFDFAINNYQQICNEFPDESEAYWWLLICKYGIEYIKDPYTGRYKPTCHRLSFESILDDSLFNQAIERASSEASENYRKKAQEISDVMKTILEISNRE